MTDTSRLVASGTNELDFASVKGHFFSNDAALRDFQTGLAVTLDFVDAFDDDFTGRGHSGNNFTLFTLILAGEDDDGITLFDVQFNERQVETSFPLQNFGCEGDNFHEIFFAEFASDGSENTSAARSFILFDDDGSVFVETDI